MMYACFLTGFAVITLLFQKTDKLKKLAFILWPAKDALLNNFDVTPAYILERLKAKHPGEEHTIGNYPNAVKHLMTGNQTSQQFEKA